MGFQVTVQLLWESSHQSRESFALLILLKMAEQRVDAYAWHDQEPDGSMSPAAKSLQNPVSAV